MHRLIQDGLEDYLAGRSRREFEVHLTQCAECRVELEEIGSVSSIFREAFTVPRTSLSPSPGFYARLAEDIEVRKTASPWNFFSIDAVFGRRVAFASLLALALAGGFLISNESDPAIEIRQGPEAVMAQQNSEPPNPSVARDRMMVTLASYDR